MTPEILLICTTVVTNSISGTTATRQCQAQQQAHAPAMTNSFDRLSFRTLNDIKADAAVAGMNAPVPHVGRARLPIRHFHSGRARLALAKSHTWHNEGWRKVRIIPTATIIAKPPQRRSFWDQLMSQN